MNCATKEYICQLFTSQNLYLWGALLFLLVILILLRRRQPQNIVAYKTENGNVTINRSAVVELVRTSCEQMNHVSKPKLTVFTRRGLTHFNIRLQLTSGGNLKDVEETLQNHLRESLSKNLGIETLGNINIFVTSFKSSRIRSVTGDNLSKAQPTPIQPKEPFDQSVETTESSEEQKN